MKKKESGPSVWRAIGGLLLLAVAFALSACEDSPTTEACLDGDPWCSAHAAGTGGTAATGGTGGGTAGTGGTGAMPCLTDPNYGGACTLPNGQPGVLACTADGSGLLCVDIHGSGGTGGTAGTGGNAGSGGFGGTGGSGGSGQYNCHDDPLNGTACELLDGGIGHFQCNANGTGLICLPNGSGTGGSGGTSGSGGTGGFGGSGGTGGSGGFGGSGGTGGFGGSGGTGGFGGTGGTGGSGGFGGTGGFGGSGGTGGSGGFGGSGGTGGQPIGCTTVTTTTASITGANSLTTLLGGESDVSWANPRQTSLANEDLIATASEAGLAITATGGFLNFWEANSGGGDPASLLDVLYCRQVGVNPDTPGACNAAVIGDRRSVQYMAGVLNSWLCWRLGTSYCATGLQGIALPSDLFVLRATVTPSTPISGYAYSGTRVGVLEMPPLCQ